MSRNLKITSNRIYNRIERIVDVVERDLLRLYAEGLDDVRVKLSRLYEAYGIKGEMTRAQLTQFVRLSNVENEILRIMNPTLTAGVTELERSITVTLDQSFYQHAWAIDQATGVHLNWSRLEDRQIRAAAGLIDDTAAVKGYMSATEARKHKKVLDRAMRNYVGDGRKIIGREVVQGIIQGKSVDQVARGINNSAIKKIHSSGMTIARTEVLRSMGVGSQMAYDESADLGVKMNQVWDATVDDRTRPDHAEMDGQFREEGYFTLPDGTKTEGPRRSGIAEQDIQCRCTVRPEVDGYSPEVRRIRDEGVQPYKTVKKWLQEHNATANRYGQKYDFLN